MNRLLFVQLVICVFFGQLQAQEIVNGKSFIQHLLSDTGTVDDIFFPRWIEQPLAIANIPFAKGNMIVPQQFIRSHKGLFVLVEGTGRVYEIKEADNNVSAHRLDSTVFFGYNFGAYSFVFKDTLYSYGGYGIWHYNGQLRVFLPHKHEWELVPLPRDLPFYTVAPNQFKAWFDREKGQLYVNKMAEKSIAHDSIFVLDMQSKKWLSKGKNILNSKILERQVHTPWGILYQGKEAFSSYLLLDLRKNRILTLSKAKSQEIINYEQWDSKYFFKDSTLFIETDNLYKISLSITDFEATSQKIYEEPEKVTLLSSFLKNTIKSQRLIAGMTICLLIGFISARLLQKNKIRKNLTPGSVSGKSVIPVFDEKEKGLIRLIFENSLRKNSTSIEDINKVLGLSDKASDLQKKHRSDTITSINQKYHYVGNTDALLLKKYRSEIDKRSFEYFLDFEDYKKLDGIL